jgi:hypothetical protein
MSRHLSNPYYWLFGFLIGLITGAVMGTMIQSSAPVAGAGRNPAGKLQSGNRSYAITAKAWDGSENDGMGSSTVQVKYYARFSEASEDLDAAEPSSSKAIFKFTLLEWTALSDGPYDGSFKFDSTVSAVLVRVSDDTPMATHFYGASGGVLISRADPLNPFYETHFERADLIDPHTGLAPVGSETYVLRVYVEDSDGNSMLQATSSSVTF